MTLSELWLIDVDSHRTYGGSNIAEVDGFGINYKDVELVSLLHSMSFMHRDYGRILLF